jgi:hypothetical protein
MFHSFYKKIIKVIHACLGKLEQEQKKMRPVFFLVVWGSNPGPVRTRQVLYH